LNKKQGDLSLSSLQILTGKTLALKSFDVDSLSVWTVGTQKNIALNQGRFQTSIDIDQSGLIALDIPGEVPVCINLKYKPIENEKRIQWVIVYPKLNIEGSELIVKEQLAQEAKLWQSSLAYLSEEAIGHGVTFTNVEKEGALDVFVMESDSSVEAFSKPTWDWVEVYTKLEEEMPDFSNTRFVVYKMSWENDESEEKSFLRFGNMVSIENPLLGIYPKNGESWDTLFSSEKEVFNNALGSEVSYRSGGAMSLLLASMAKYDSKKTDTTKVNFQTGNYGLIQGLFTTEVAGDYLEFEKLFIEPSQINDLLDSGWIKGL
jgi:hypothetical protein